MAIAQGLSPVLILPKMPKTPATSAIAPPITITRAKILIIIEIRIGYGSKVAECKRSAS